MVSLFLLLLICDIGSSSNDHYCPSRSWTPCAPSGHTCEIPGNINQTTISFGGFNPSQQYNTLGQWDFTEITNTRGDVFKIECSSSVFGKIYPNRGSDNPPLGCCYTANTADSFANFMGPSTNEGNWNKLAHKGKNFIAYPTQYVRYGAVDELGAVYIYRWMQGEFVCQPSWFGAVQLWKNAIPMCSTISTGNVSATNFIQCGDSKINNCNLDVIGTSSKDESILLVQYGNYPNFVYRYVYSTNNNDQIPCNNGLFGAPNGGSGGNQFCAASNHTVFTGAVGYWEDVESCAGSACIIDTEVMYGTTSTNTKSTTTSWEHSVSQTVSTGFEFHGASFSYSLTTETSESVSHTVSNSYTQSASKTCGVKCGNGTSDDWTVYQWQFKMAEYIGTDLDPFEIYACYYVCSTSKKEPQCPPGYCLPGTDCTKCQGWSPPNSTFVVQ